MSVHTGPNNSENGLVFYYDMGNTQKSWRGMPVTNLCANPLFINGSNFNALRGRFGI